MLTHPSGWSPRLLRPVFIRNQCTNSLSFVAWLGTWSCKGTCTSTMGNATQPYQTNTSSWFFFTESGYHSGQVLLEFYDFMLQPSRLSSLFPNLDVLECLTKRLLGQWFRGDVPGAGENLKDFSFWEVDMRSWRSLWLYEYVRYVQIPKTEKNYKPPNMHRCCGLFTWIRTTLHRMLMLTDSSTQAKGESQLVGCSLII